jgi:hypothetical protein
LVLVLLPLLSWKNVASTKSLIIAAYDAQAAQNHIVHLYKIPFTEGITGPQEKVMDVLTQQPGDKVPRIRFDLGPNTLYRGRWIITAYGNVIDLKAKKVLLDQHDRYVGAWGDSLVFYTNDIFRGKFYSVLFLNTGKYEQVTTPLFQHPIIGQDVEVDYSQEKYKIWHYPPSRPKRELVGDAGYGEDISQISGAKPAVPVFWLNNDQFIFARYSEKHDRATIVQVKVSKGWEYELGVIENIPASKKLSSFYRAPRGLVVYECGAGTFSVDPDNRKVTPLDYYPVNGNADVYISTKENEPKGRTIRHGVKPIGTYFCDPASAVGINGYIAFPYEIVMGGEHYLQGAAVWSAAGDKWKTIGDSDLCAVIGWLEE